jgi:hypothetical protein
VTATCLNIVVIDVKERGRMHISKIKIVRWRLLETLFFIVYAQFGYPIFEGMFTLYYIYLYKMGAYFIWLEILF